MANPNPKVENLRRGGISHDAQLKGIDAMNAAKARKAALLVKAKEDKWGAYEEMHVMMTKSLLKLLKEEERQGSVQRDVTDRMREYRMGLEKLTEYLALRSQEDQAKDFFEDLNDRLSELDLASHLPEPPLHPNDKRRTRRTSSPTVDANNT